MKTSYFGKMKKISEGEENFVCISRSCPKGVKVRMYAKLAPPWQLLNDYKQGICNWDDYVRIYKEEVLNKLDPHAVYQELGALAILFCYEKVGDNCHRHIVSEWFREHGYDVTELEV